MCSLVLCQKLQGITMQNFWNSFSLQFLFLQYSTLHFSFLSLLKYSIFARLYIFLVFSSLFQRKSLQIEIRSNHESHLLCFLYSRTQTCTAFCLMSEKVVSYSLLSFLVACGKKASLVPLITSQQEDYTSVQKKENKKYLLVSCLTYCNFLFFCYLQPNSILNTSICQAPSYVFRIHYFIDLILAP